jgi:hypothetical protein
MQRGLFFEFFAVCQCFYGVAKPFSGAFSGGGQKFLTPFGAIAGESSRGLKNLTQKWQFEAAGGLM